MKLYRFSSARGLCLFDEDLKIISQSCNDNHLPRLLVYWYSSTLNFGLILQQYQYNTYQFQAIPKRLGVG